MKGYVYFIGLGDGRRLGWRVIAWFTGSNAVHVGMRFDNDCYETSETVYEKVSWSSRQSGSEVLALFEVVNGDNDNGLKTAQDSLGTLYDYPNILGLGLFFLLQRTLNWLRSLVGAEPTRIQITNTLGSKGLLQCAESSAVVLAAMGVAPISTWNNKENLYPALLLEYCFSNPDHFILVGGKLHGQSSG